METFSNFAQPINYVMRTCIFKVILTREAEDAFEDRKNLAKKLGEEAGTKLMIPLFLMLIVVFAIVIIPAFLSIKL